MMFWSHVSKSKNVARSQVKRQGNVEKVRSTTWRPRWWRLRKIWKKRRGSGRSSLEPSMLHSGVFLQSSVSKSVSNSRRTALEADRDEYKRLYEKSGT